MVRFLNKVRSYNKRPEQIAAIDKKGFQLRHAHTRELSVKGS
jgi:hypothetical protein